jgi:transcriptional regulator with XRE-family HTH domain
LDSDKKTFGEWLARTRKAADLRRQEDLADLIGTTKQTVSNWETGKNMPGIEFAAALSRALGVSQEELTARAMRQEGDVGGANGSVQTSAPEEPGFPRRSVEKPNVPRLTLPAFVLRIGEHEILRVDLSVCGREYHAVIDMLESGHAEGAEG